MELPESIIIARSEHLADVVALAIELWPDYAPEDLKTTFAELLVAEKFRIYLYRLQGEFIGFIYLGIRTDYVEGSDSSPTGYVEGIYVKPAYRRQGISRALLQAGEHWVKDRGCHQIGSDIYLNNTVSYHFHTSLGFAEAGRLIAFIKNL